MAQRERQKAIEVRLAEASLGDVCEKYMQQLEQRIKEALNKSTAGQVSDQDGENFYRLLGAYRGLSDATLEYSSSARLFNWEQWYETRF